MQAVNEREMRHLGLVEQTAELEFGPLGPIPGSYRIIIRYLEPDDDEGNEESE